MEEKNSNVTEHLTCGCGHCGKSKIYFDKINTSFFNLYGLDLLKIFLSVLFVFAGVIISGNYMVKLLLSLLSVFICGYNLFFNFCKSFFNKNFLDENALMLLASITAFCLGEFIESALIVILFNLGGLFERIATDNSRKKISGLKELKNKEVNVITNDGIVSMRPEDVPIGSLLEIRMGESVLIDGVLIGLPTEIDMKAVTGESKLCLVRNGETVYSGCVNMGNPIVVKTIKRYNDSMAQKIVEMVEGALSKKAKSQKFISKFAKVYTPIVFSLALLISLIIPLFDDFNYVKWVYKALSFLVISCPCALVISVPLGYFIGIGSLAKIGVLVKGSKYLDALSKTELVVFDKTGTVTEGYFSVDRVIAYGKDKLDVLSCVYSLERKSTHPIAKAICDYCKNEKAFSNQVEKFIEHTGKGVSGYIDNQFIVIGNDKLLHEYYIKQPNKNEYLGTVLYVSRCNKVIGEIHLSDKIKSDAVKWLDSLKKIGINKTAMLSGDNFRVVKNVGDVIGVNEYYGQLLPNEKLTKLENLMKDVKNTTIYVGDGINDSPSIATADVGIAMGGLGSDVAIESADVVIMKDELSKITTSIKHSKKVKRIIFENIIGSLFVKFSVMIISLITILPVYISMVADVGVMLLAVTNSLRNSLINKK